MEESLSIPAVTPRKRKPALPKLIEKYYADLADLAHQNVMFSGGNIQRSELMWVDPHPG
jgi:hypothetical protein